MLVTFYGGINTDTSVAVNDPTSAASGGVPPVDSSVWSSRMMSSYVGSAIYVQKGTLVVDIVDAGNKRLAWRGIAIGNLDTNPSKALEDVDKAVEKMFAKYPLKGANVPQGDQP